MSAAALPLPAEPVFQPGRIGACLGAVALVSLMAFEAMAVAAAMPAIAQALDGIHLYALSFGGMLAMSVVGMVMAGASSDRRGPQRATVAGLLVFAAGLLMAGLAGSMGWLVAGRVLQGLGSGMLGVVLYVGMGQIVPSAAHPRLFALLAAAWVLPALVGPPVAAWMVAQFGWRSVFLGVAGVMPVAAVLLVPAFGRLAAPPRAVGMAAPGRARIGWAALAACGALLLHGAGNASGVAWMLVSLAIGLVAAVAASRRLLPRGTLVAARGLPTVIALRGLLASAFASAEVFVPLYLTREAGWSLAEAGLALSAGAVMWSSGSAVQARLADARHRRRGLRAGFLAVAAGIGFVSVQMCFGLPAWALLVGWAVAGFGIGLSFPMLSVLTLGMSAPAEQGGNASALQLSDALCSSAALAMAGALFAAAPAGGALRYAAVVLMAALLALGGAVLSRRAVP
jgi:MFS family permease